MPSAKTAETTEPVDRFVEQCLKPFAENVIGKLPRITCQDCSKKVCKTHPKQWCDACRQTITTQHMHLDYVGHAVLTRRMLEIDSEWNWEPLAFGDDGLPKVVFHSTPKDGEFGVLWIRLTLGGVTRLGVGTAPKGKQDLMKELIGDALRNAGLRFGLALDLWAKGDIVEDDDAPPTEAKQASSPKPAAPVKAATTRTGAAPPKVAKKAAAPPRAPVTAPRRAAEAAPADTALDASKAFSKVPKDRRQELIAQLHQNPVMTDAGPVLMWPLPTDKTLGEDGEALAPDVLAFAISETIDAIEAFLNPGE